VRRIEGEPDWIAAGRHPVVGTEPYLVQPALVMTYIVMGWSCSSAA
jgi:hypothetical protein